MTHVLLGLPGCSGIPCSCEREEDHWVDLDDDGADPLPDIVLLEPRQTVYAREPGRIPACSYCGFPHDPDDPMGCGF